MAKIKEKERALFLRKKGRSINIISKELDVSKSTVSYWCRDISLSPAQINKLALKRRRAGIKSFMQATEKRRAKRKKDTAQMKSLGKADVGTLSQRDLYILGLGLYWGEGYKRGNEETGFTNSDPAIIRVILKWFQDIFSIPLSSFTLRVSINKLHQARENEILKYWSKVTKVPRNQFTKTSFLKQHSKKVYQDSSHYYGTLRVKVQKGTNLRRRILGSLSALEDL